MTNAETIILHHYAGSLFSEKIRVILGLKGLAWSSVSISPIMPRPDLMPLTGGYRKTPVMQIGADIYCDTRIIAARLDELSPEPALEDPQRPFVADAISLWADSHLFRVVVGVCFSRAAIAAQLGQLSEAQRQAFAKDRAELARGATGLDRLAPEVASAALIGHLERLERQLAPGSGFLLGAVPRIADFSVYHCLWLVRKNTAVAGLFEPYPAVIRWMDRIAAYGHGERAELDSRAALEIATRSTPSPIGGFEPMLPPGIELGARVSVVPLDYGLVPVTGELVIASSSELAIRRTDSTAGEIVVHFPRAGFRVDPASDSSPAAD